jgi:hypothetical protein
MTTPKCVLVLPVATSLLMLPSAAQAQCGGGGPQGWCGPSLQTPPRPRASYDSSHATTSEMAAAHRCLLHRFTQRQHAYSA